MDIATYHQRRSHAYAFFVGYVTMTGKLLADGTYTAQEAARHIAHADAELTRKLDEVSAEWDAVNEVAS